VQIAPFDFGHCTRLIIATPSDHAIDMATNRLQSLLERSGGRPPFRSAKGNPAEDEDIWWAFDGAVKDLAYQGVDVAIMKCREHEGFYLPLGEWNPKGEGEKFIFGMAQAVRHARGRGGKGGGGGAEHERCCRRGGEEEEGEGVWEGDGLFCVIPVRGSGLQSGGMNAWMGLWILSLISGVEVMF
jgi:hypothetical protein